ncbi:MAG TPA: hypothetical protein VE152_00730 [Acidimicrobiales bacterium]|jgi:hypothetical protein|nr:hypothetical protein [Acidimicrobiales bacterium]
MLPPRVRAAAVGNLVLGGFVMAVGTGIVLAQGVLGWVWVGFGVALTGLGFLWTRQGGEPR